MNEYLELNQEQFAEMDFSLTKRSKSGLFVCSYDTNTTKEVIIKMINDRHPEYENLSKDTTGIRIISLFRYLKKELPQTILAEPNIKHIVHVTGLEHTLLAEIDEKHSILFDELNFERELIFRDLPIILFIWVNKSTLKRMQKEAPDFFDWVTERYVFKGLPEAIDNTPLSKDTVRYENPGFLPERIQRVNDLEIKYNSLDQTGEPTPRDWEDRYNLLKLLADESTELREFEKAEKNYFRAISIAQRLKSESKLIHCYYDLGNMFLESRDFEKAIEYLEKTERLGNKTKSIQISSIYHQIGRVYEEQRIWDKAIKNYKKAIEENKKANVNHQIGATYHQIGMVYQEQRTWDKAIKNYKKAIEENKKANINHQIGAAYHQIGRVYQEQRIWDKAIKNYKKAIEENKKANLFHRLGGTYHQIGMVYQEQRTWDKAIKYYEKAVENKEKTKLYHELGSTYHQIGRVYEEQKIWDKAIKYYEKTIEENKKANLFHRLGGTYLQIGIVYSEQKNFKSALNNFQIADDWLVKTKMLHQRYYIFWNRGTLFEGQSDLDKTLKNYEKAIELVTTHQPHIVKILEKEVGRIKQALAESKSPPSATE